MIKKNFIFFIFAIVITSCAANKDIIYLHNNQAVGSEETSTVYENTLQPDDNLIITVTAANPELAYNFNLMYLNGRSNDMTSANNTALYSYNIDQKGEIDFPVIGKIKLSGLTRIQAEEKIKDLIKNYIVNPGVSLRVLNFKVSVFGEVIRPGAQVITGDRITILEAISQAGDMTIYGRRKDVTVIREKDGVKTINVVDLTDANLINSPVYYLAHNDVVYIKPNKTRINSSVIGPNLTVGLSALSLLVTIIALSIR
jgi:polysaccharide export outer membrane protein